MNPTGAGEHTLAFYTTDEFLADTIADFAASGLEAGDHVVVVVTTAHWTAIAERLDGRGVAHGYAAQQGRLVMADAELVLDQITVDGEVRPERFRAIAEALLPGAPRLRIYGEVSELLIARGEIEAAARLEQVAQELARDHGIRILCGCHARLTDEARGEMERTHHTSFAEGDQTLPPGARHAVRFFPDATVLSRIVTDFVGAGLAAGQAGLIVGRPAHRQSIVEQLTRRGFDVAHLERQKRLCLADAETVLSDFMTGDVPDAGRFEAVMGTLFRTLAEGPTRPLRVYGEMVDVLWQRGDTGAAIRLETLWNELARSHAFQLLCGYTMGPFYKRSDLDAIRGQHTHLLG